MPTTDLDCLSRDFTALHDGRPLLTLAEAAVAARVHPNTLRKAISLGDLRCSRRSPSGRISIRNGELAAWILRGEQFSRSARGAQA
jgi:hypothetical protein